MPGFAAIGGMAIFSGMAGAIGAMATGIVVSAVVGAAVGGLVSAVTGGDIGKGMLFGAIGGVVTGGIAGQGISSLFTGAQPLVSGATVGTSQGSATFIGAGESGTFLTQTAAAPVAKAGLSATGSIVKDIAVASAPELIKGIGAGILAGRQQELEAPKQPKISAGRSGGGGGGGGGPSLEDQLALQAAQDEAAMARLLAEGKIGDRQIGLKSDSALKEMGKEYELAKDKSAFEHGQAWDKQKATAAGAAATEYQSGEGAYEAVVAAQKARGDQGTGRENSQIYPDTALAGEEEAMA